MKKVRAKENIKGVEICGEWEVMTDKLTTKVWRELENKKWELYGNYWNKYPTDWVKTINRCLEKEENKWEFRYDSNGELEQIKIITIEPSGAIWNFYIKIIGEKNNE